MPARLFVFTGAKGGVGVSTTLAQLAKSLKDREHAVLVDADLLARRSEAILLDAVQQLDAAAAQSDGVPTARVDGVTLIELTQTYETAFTLSSTDLEHALSAIDAGIVLVDAPMPFSAVVRPVISRAHRFFIVTEPSILGVAAAKKMVAQFERFGVPHDRLSAVLCARSSSKVNRSEVERVLEIPVVAELPGLDDRGFGRALGSLEQAMLKTPDVPALSGLSPSDSGEIRDRRSPRKYGTGGQVYANGSSSTPDHTGSTEREALKAAIHRALAETVNLLDASKAQGDAKKLAQMRARITDIAQTVIMNTGTKETAESLAQLKEEIVSETLGLGPLEDFMDDPDITEIMVNGPDEVYIERFGVIEETNKHFTDNAALRLVIERIITPLGRRVDEAVPMVDARLPDGSRVNAIIEPLALNGPTLTIRRFGSRRLTDQDLLEKGSASKEVLSFLRACVESRLNLVISGGTGSGKTTLLNILSSYLGAKERIITIEDAAELKLNQRHVVRLESRPPNLEGTGQITIRDLVRNALRMRPDRIVVGECRGSEALDMLQAMNTGHDGSLTTVHANTARDALSRIETMVLMAGFDLPVRAIREQLSSAVDMVVQTARLRDGSRKIVGVSEVVGMEGDIVTMQEIVRFAQHGVDDDGRVKGEFEYTGVQPLAFKRFEEYGVRFDRRTFSALPMAASIW